MAKDLLETLKKIGIAERMLSINMDNASNNDTLAEELARKLAKDESFDLDNRLRCTAHIVQLVAKEMSFFKEDEDESGKQDSGVLLILSTCQSASQVGQEYQAFSTSRGQNWSWSSSSQC